MGTFPVHMGWSAHAREMFPSLLRVTIPNDPPPFLPSFTRVVGHMFAKVLYTHEGKRKRGGLSMPIITRMGEGQG